MAEAMQGIMSLPPEMGGMDNAPRTFLTPEDDATLTRLRESVTPQEFSTQMLDAAEQADPQVVSQLRTMLRGMQLPPELIDMMQQMVEALLDEPAKYAENRRDLIAEGVPEELLPEQFDPMYLAALNMALDQLSGPMVQGFAAGGLVRNPIAQGIASLGRNGDTMLAHITPGEARMLRRRGGSGTINPATGLPEFFFKKLAKAVGGVFKAVGKAVTSTVKRVAGAIKSFAKSSVGRIVTSVALGFFLGPAAASMLGVTSAAGVAAMSGFVGGAGSTLLAGGSVTDALKAGAIGGLSAGAISGVTGGAQAFQAGSYTGPTTISGQAQKLTDQWNKLTGGAKPTLGTTPGAAAETLDEAAAAKGAPTAGTPATAARGASSVPNYKINPATGKLEFDGTFTTTQTDALGRTVNQTTTGTPSFGAPSPAAAPNLDVLKADAISGRVGAVPTPSIETLSPAGAPSPVTNLSSYTGPGGPAAPINLSGRIASLPSAPPPDVAGRNFLTGSLDEFGGPARPPVTPNYLLESPANVGGPNMPPVAAPAQAAAPSKGVMDLLTQGEFKQAAGRAYDYISPTEIQRQGAENALLQTQKAFPGATTEQIINAPAGSILAKTYEANMPGMLATYGPMAAVGTGAAYLAGAFDVKQPPKPEIPMSGAELYARNPYYITPDVNTIYASTGRPYEYTPGGATLGAQSMFANPMAYTQPTYMRTGGIASLATGKYPRRTGAINGPGTGTSDSIPAMLSDGEFVFTAKAVRAMGNGSRRKGAKRMYALMKALENKG
jgi:hypothetical protein